MKKLIFYIAFFILPFVIYSQNPPPPGLEDPPVTASIDKIDIVLFFTAIYIGVFFFFRKAKPKDKTPIIKRNMRRQSDKSN
jgi:hypothetical protein